MAFYTKDLKNTLDQGDVLLPQLIKNLLPWWPNETEKQPLVVMTPACDIEQRKVDYHRLCVALPFPFHVSHILTERVGVNEAQIKGTEPLGSKKQDKLKQDINRTITNAWPRYHYLPWQDEVFTTDRFIDFEQIITVPVSDVSAEHRMARILSPYKEAIIHRYTHYNMRIGMPDLSKPEKEKILSSAMRHTSIELT